MTMCFPPTDICPKPLPFERTTCRSAQPCPTQQFVRPGGIGCRQRRFRIRAVVQACVVPAGRVAQFDQPPQIDHGVGLRRAQRHGNSRQRLTQGAGVGESPKRNSLAMVLRGAGWSGLTKSSLGRHLWEVRVGSRPSVSRFQIDCHGHLQGDGQRQEWQRCPHRERAAPDGEDSPARSRPFTHAVANRQRR